MKNPLIFKSLNPTLIFIIISTGLMGIFSITVAQDNPYTIKANMPTARLGVATAVVNDSIYAIGGYAGANQPGLTANEVYDPATNTWDTRAPMPTGRRWMAASTVDDKIYVFGGYTNVGQPGLPIVEEYDPKTDTWTSKTDMPTPRLGPSSCVVNGIIYVIGGASAASQPLSKVEAYDPQTDTWTQKANMPTARHTLVAGVVEGKIYAIGGQYGSGLSYTKVEEYDPETDTWTEKADMPTARSGLAASVVNGKIYAIGGGYGTDFFSAVEEYDPATDSWAVKADLPEVRVGPGCSTVNEKIYIIGGAIQGFDAGHPGTKRVEEYVPSKDLTSTVNKVSLNKCFVAGGNDSICITAKMNDLAGVTLYAMIEPSDQAFLDSIQLFDDGNHNDGNAGDSIYSNTWQIGPEEKLYYVDLRVIQVSGETIIHRMNNMAAFTTVGPVAYENYAFGSSPLPGENVKLELTLTNKGLITTASGVKAKLTSLDPLATETSGNYISFLDISPGESKARWGYRIEISESCPENTEIQCAIDITSEGYSFWRDTFSIVVGSPTAISQKGDIQQKFSLNQNYPNPFKSTTIIPFNLLKPAFVTIKVYDDLGKERKTLVNELVYAGKHCVTFDASNFPSGLYFYKMQAGDMAEMKKMLLIR